MPAGDPGGNFADTGGYGGNFPGAGGSAGHPNLGGNPTTASGGVGDYGVKQALANGAFNRVRNPAQRAALLRSAQRLGLNPYTGAPVGTPNKNATGTGYRPGLKKTKIQFPNALPVTQPPFTYYGVPDWYTGTPQFRHLTDPNGVFQELSPEDWNTGLGWDWAGKDQDRIPPGGTNSFGGTIGWNGPANGTSIGKNGPSFPGKDQSQIGAYADGGVMAPGQLGLVGERGPELAQALPSGGTAIHPLGGIGNMLEQPMVSPGPAPMRPPQAGIGNMLSNNMQFPRPNAPMTRPMNPMGMNRPNIQEIKNKILMALRNNPRMGMTTA